MKKHFNIAVLPGDGVGEEVTDQAVKVIKKVGQKFNIKFSFQYGLIGAKAIYQKNYPLPEETKKIVLKADAILFGAVGDPAFDADPKAKIRPEQGILQLRKLLNLYANIRPIQTYPILYKKSPLKEEIIKDVDFIVVRELTGGIYFGEPRGRSEDGKKAFDTCVYHQNEIIRVAKIAFDLAKKRRKKITVVDKANVLATSRLWRETIPLIAKDYPEVIVDYLYVDNAAMQIIKKPKDFDVILTENMFGDILTDEASMITGSIGMLPSSSIGEIDGRKRGLFEPIHGSYPKAAGKDIANPIGAILSAGQMFRFLNLIKEAEVLEKAVVEVLNNGCYTKDIKEDNYLTCSQMGEAIVKQI